MAKKKTRKPKVSKPWVAKNRAPKMPVAQGLKKGFTIPEGMSN